MPNNMEELEAENFKLRVELEDTRLSVEHLQEKVCVADTVIKNLKGVTIALFIMVVSLFGILGIIALI